MPQPPTINDIPVGEIVKIGTPTVTFNLAGVLVAEDIQWEKGFNSVDFADYSNDSIGGSPGAIRSAAYSATKGMGSMTVQVKNLATVVFPGEFVTFNHPGFTTLKFIVTSVGIAYTQNGATKFRVSFAEYLAESTLPQLITFDGDFATAKACGPVLFSNPLPMASNAFVYRQKFKIFRPNFGRLPMNTPGPISGTYLVEETELQDTGVADVVTWDRVYANVPNLWAIPVSAVKNYQAANYTWNGSNQLTDQSIISWTQSIKATMTHRYYLDASFVPGLPGLPILILIRYFNSQVLNDVGTGFPTRTYPFGTGYDNNFAPSYISAVVEPWLGAMMVVKTIQG